MSLARFGVRNPVPVNLLMTAILIAGIVAGLSLRREFFPEQDPESATLTLPYPGATPEEVEDALAIKVENQLIDLDEVDELSVTLAEGGGGMTIKFREGIDAEKALDEVDRAIDTLQDLPDESEEITTQLLEPRLPVIRVAVFGDLEESVMKDVIRGVRDDLLTLEGMGEVLIDGVRDYEIRVDVRQDALLQQGIALPEVADAVGAWMREIPGGTVKNVGGNVKVRTMGVAERAEAIRQIVVRSFPDGRTIALGDIAEVSEGFVDDQIINRFNSRTTDAPPQDDAMGEELIGKPAAMLTVFKVGDQDIVNMAKSVRSYVKGRQGKPFDGTALEVRFGSDRYDAYLLGLNSPTPLPRGVSVSATSDLARFVEGRLDLLTRNAGYGAILVFATLLVFLNWRVAFWVGVGLLTAILGTLVLMSAIDVTLNLLTMFGLIVVLGLLVDDAIVVSENIQARHDRGEPSFEAAVGGTNQVSWPVVATVLTSIVAFLPLSFIKGNIGDLLGALPIVVACALIMSLIETLLILPSHMAHSLVHRDRALADQTKPHRLARAIKRFEEKRDYVIFEKVVPAYARLLKFSLRYRYLAIVATFSVFIGTMSLWAGGRVVFEFLPNNDAETLVVDLRMPIGTPIEDTNAAVAAVEQAAFGQREVQSVASVVGQRSDIDTGQADGASTHVAQMFIELYYVELRDRESSKVIQSIRDELQGKLDAVDRINFSEISGGPSGPGITVRVRGKDGNQIDAAVADLKTLLAGFEGVVDINDDNDLGQAEQRIVPRPADIRSVGLTPADVALQVRGFLFGIDAHTYADQQEDIDVRVRVDERTRRDLGAIENAWLVTPTGSLVPLSEVADIEEATTYSTIKRVDRQRTVTVTAETIPSVSTEDVTAAIDLDEVRKKYPQLTIEYAGRQEQMGDAFGSLPLGMGAACLMIYVILAWLFSSYFQPLTVMLIIPFSLIGVVWGHLLLGYNLTFLSLIGIVALSGIVVNDSLILVEFFNHERQRGMAILDALIAAGRARLRPILLTTITTVLGLTPLILEQSFQAKFLIPMGISIAAGLLSATVLILVVLPCWILIFDDIRRGAYYLWHGRAKEKASPNLFSEASA
ncbi:efflux RND transporter permease subunit [Algisphaera agarilytica]|uniref:Multidrug efflux pump subunit AcrB n=1 Tax=Algisphaera agarilytica TaxID=1385975 RepID=A0A7X0LJW0_9BACT|nr:efflux RND transporter permease subunit [Algisphaera agarilytica]MBB6429001.1 multidrug efflux pump subunit AcrB [Algisphaera agarilytica]